MISLFLCKISKWHVNHPNLHIPHQYPYVIVIIWLYREQPPFWDPATKLSRLQIPLLGHTSSAASIVYWQFYLLQNCSYLVLYCVHLCHVYFAGWRLGQVLLKLPPHWRTSWCVQFFLNANIFRLFEKYSFRPGEPAVGGWRPISVFILDRGGCE